MYPHVKKHLTPETAREYFSDGYSKPDSGCATILLYAVLILFLNILGVIIVLLMRASKRTISKDTPQNDLPEIIEEVCVDRYVEEDFDSGPDTYYLRFARLGTMRADRHGSDDITLCPSYTNTSVGDKFYVAIWPSSGHKPLFFNHKYWRIEELTREELEQAAQLEEKMMSTVAHDLDCGLRDRLVDKCKKMPSFPRVSAAVPVEDLSLAEKLAVQYFDGYVAAAMEYICLHGPLGTVYLFEKHLTKSQLALFRLIRNRCGM